MKLPLWRLIAAILVLLAMASVLFALAPVYFEDYQLRQYVRSLVRSPQNASMTDDAFRAAVITRAKQLDLPVAASDIQITHPDSRLHVQLNYAVQLDFPVYQVEVHFHPGATGP
jgi:hypothetical protein